MGKRTGIWKVHSVAKSDGLKRVTACGRVAFQTSIPSEIETALNVRLEVTPHSRLVTCVHCLRVVLNP